MGFLVLILVFPFSMLWKTGVSHGLNQTYLALICYFISAHRIQPDEWLFFVLVNYLFLGMPELKYSLQEDAQQHYFHTHTSSYLQHVLLPCSPALISHYCSPLHTHRQVLYWEWLSSNREIIHFFTRLQDRCLWNKSREKDTLFVSPGWWELELQFIVGVSAHICIHFLYFNGTKLLYVETVSVCVCVCVSLCVG